MRSSNPRPRPLEPSGLLCPALTVFCAALLAGCAGLGAPPAALEGDFLVVALGDSYASGQGAPNESAGSLCSPSWDDKRCNRSKHAATRQAVEIRRAAGDSVGFDSVACSGATVERGLIGAQMGPEPEPGDSPLPPQVTALKALAQGLPSGDELDAITISIGGNDIWFQNIVLACIATECEFSHPVVELELSQLPDLLDALAEELDDVPGLAPDEILLVEYPDPTRDSDGTPCDREPVFPPELFGRISKSDSEYAASYVLPTLNHHLCEAAKRHGWIWVDGVSPSFGGHGWCAQPDSWINTVTESTLEQGHYRGAMHPNIAGHAAVAGQISDVLAQMISGSPPSPPTSCPAAPPAPSP